ncbi:MAG: TetR/AcrR family transcriptional regulator [Candidatus Methylomirabilia bacterium]
MSLKRQAMRDQILRTAADLFQEKGYRATTLDGIAARLGVSKATIYAYFRAKEEILAAISQETIAAFTRDLASIGQSRLDPEEKLRRVVRQHVRLVLSNRSFLTVFFSEEANLPPRIARALARQKDRYDRGVEAIVRAGIRKGTFRPVEPRLVVYGLLGMMNWLYKWYRPGGRWGADEIARSFLSVIERGLLRPLDARGPGVARQLNRLSRELSRTLGALT